MFETANDLGTSIGGHTVTRAVIQICQCEWHSCSATTPLTSEASHTLLQISNNTLSCYTVCVGWLSQSLPSHT